MKNYLEYIEDLKIHLLIITIFFVLTSIMTFPVIINFDTEFAGIGVDTWQYIWTFWWDEKAKELELDSLQTNFIFYPNEIAVIPISPFIHSIALILLQSFNYVLTWNIIWFLGFILAGYGCFLLANYFTKNFIASLAAGIIFSFSSFHIGSGLGHLDQSTFFWIPFFILFLFKTSRSDSLINPLLAGIFLFMATITSYYFGFMLILFSLVFFVAVFFQRKEVTIKKIFTRLLLVYALAFVLSFYFIFPVISLTTSDEILVKRPIQEFYANSVGPADFLAPSSLHYFVKLFDITWVNNAYISYLGITVVILSLFAIIKFRNKYAPFWILTTGIFAILSFGPELKIFGELTGILLPQKLFYDTVPGWDMFRVPYRFVLLISLSTSILAAYGISGIIKKHFSSYTKKIIFGIFILFLLTFEFAAIPYPTTAMSTPMIYELIKNDSNELAIIEAPIGGSGEVGLLSDPKFLFYQTFHEKPFFGGYYSRIPIDDQRGVQTYFLNQFVWYGEMSDIINQDLSEVGISIFNYYNIGYVIIHKNIEWFWIQDRMTSHFIPEIKQRMIEILGTDEPLYEDSELIVYQIPVDASTESFIILGSGWDILERKAELVTRSIGPYSEIIIVNPTNDEKQVYLEFQLSSIDLPRPLTIIKENMTLFETEITTENTTISTNSFTIKPGKNVISLVTEGFKAESPHSNYEKDRETSLKFSSIYLENTL